MTAPQQTARVVLLTRRHEDNLRTGRHLEDLGVPWRSLPCIGLDLADPGPQAVEAVTRALPVSAAAFTSRWSVAGLVALPALVERWELKEDPCLVGAVGPSTARRLEDSGFRVDLVADPPTAKALGRALGARLAPDSAVLVPRGDRARPELDDALTQAGMRVLPITVYRHAPVHLTGTEPPCPLEAVAVVVCASPSAADALLSAFPELARRKFVALGPTTEQHLRSLGAVEVIVAGRADPRGLAEFAVRAWRAPPGSIDPRR